jgi:hypothetical protein
MSSWVYEKVYTKKDVWLVQIQHWQMKSMLRLACKTPTFSKVSALRRGNNSSHVACTTSLATLARIRGVNSLEHIPASVHHAIP